MSSSAEGRVLTSSIRSFKRKMSVLSVVLVLVGIIMAYWRVSSADHQMRAAFLELSGQIASSLHVDLFRDLQGADTDLARPSYIRLKSYFQKLHHVYPECRFLYILGQRADGEVYVLVDSEPKDSPDYSPPGDIYYEVDEDALEVFRQKHALAYGPTEDRWGRWVTALVPLHDAQNVDDLLVFGMDIDAGDWNQKLIRVAIPPFLLVASLLAVIWISIWLGIHREWQGRRSTRWMRMLEVWGACVIGLLVTAYVSYEVYEAEGRQHDHVFKQLAFGELDCLVDRIHDLRDHELNSLARFVGAQAVITKGAFSFFADSMTEVPLIYALGWAPAVSAADLADFIENRRAKGAVDYAVWESDDKGNPRALSTRASYYPVALISPLSLQYPLLGFDLHSYPAFQNALDQAIELRLPAATDPLDLGHIGLSGQGIMVYYPVRVGYLDDAVLGVVFAIVHADDLVMMFRDTQVLRARIHLVNMGGSLSELGSAPGMTAELEPGAVRRPVMALGHVFLAQVLPGPEYLAHHRSGRWVFVGIAGMMVTLVITLLISEPIRRRDELSALVAERTSELEQSREAYRMLVDHQIDLLVKVDLAGRLLFVSPSYCRMFGKSENLLVGQKYMPFVHEDDRAATDAATAALLQPPHTAYVEQRAATAHGWRWLAWVSNATLNEAGDVDAIIAVGRDITEQKGQEAERERLLEEAEGNRKALTKALEEESRGRAERARLVSAIEQTGESVVVTDRRGMIQYVNPAFSETSGYTREEVIGQATPILKSGKQDAVFYQAMWKTIEKGLIWSGRIVNKKKSGELFTEDITISPVHDHEGQIVNYVAVKRDITRELEVEAQLKQSQKMEVIGQLAGGVAHDFNNLLQSIMGFTDLALEEEPDSPYLKEHLREVRKSSQSAVALTRQLLAFSRRQVLQKEQLDLPKLIQNMTNMIQRLVGENIRLEIDVADGPVPPVLGDAGQIEQVLMNLIVNARDAMPQGGRIHIETKQVLLEKEDVEVHAGARPGQFISVSVSDTGMGMTEEVRAHIFEPFYTTKKSGKGTGLGLSTVYGIVRQHDGWISVYSEPNGGSVFRIYFPVDHSGGASAIDRIAELTTDVKGQGEYILLVEDEAGVQRLMKRMLEGNGYRVMAASSAEEALEYYEREKGLFDMILSDVVLPGRSGFDLVAQLKKINPKLKVVMASGYTDERTRWPEIREKGWRFLQKPVSRKILLATIREVLDRDAARKDDEAGGPA